MLSFLTIPTISTFFLFFALNTITGSLLVILSINPVHAVIALIFAFFNSACLFILLNAEFLALTVVIVYVGAIAVLFLFVIMMLNLKEIEIKNKAVQSVQSSLFLTFLAAFLVLSTYFIGVKGRADDFNIISLGTEFSSRLVPSEGQFLSSLTPVSQINSLGYYLYTDYFLYFVAAAVILLVAMIGAIVITTKFGELVRRQRASEQISSTPRTFLFF